METDPASKRDKRECVGALGNGARVVVGLEGTHAATHLQTNPELLTLVKEALPKLVHPEAGGDFEVDLGRIIGESSCIETRPTDEIVYAKRPNRDSYTRFVVGRETVPASTVVVRLEKVADDEYNLFTAYVGHAAPEFPISKDDDPERIAFWNTHALVWGTQPVLPETVTKDCPWD